jgi:hypothetical protein
MRSRKRQKRSEDYEKAPVYDWSVERETGALSKKQYNYRPYC